MDLSIITLAEILRDFHQYIYLIIQGLGDRISDPTKFIFIKPQNWISLNLYYTIGLRVSITMFGQLILLVLCSSYLFALTLQSLKKKHQGIEAQSYAEIGRFMKFFNLITIFIITTLFQPIINNSLMILFDFIDGMKQEEEILAKILAVISLIIMLIIIPIIFMRGIKFTRPSQNQYDKRGGLLMDQREIYSEFLAKTQSPFMPIFKEYSFDGAYFKLVIMIYKFAQLILLFNKPNPFDNSIRFIVQYSIFSALSLILFIYIYKKRPYLNDKLNNLYISNIITTLWCLACNVAIFFLDDKDANNKNIQLMFAVFQIIGCLFIFLFNFIHIILINFPSVVRFFQKINSQLIFTEVKDRGVNQDKIIGLNTNKYLKNIVFNPNIYDRNSEVCISIWQDFWQNIITTDQKFKSTVKINNLVFINPGNAPPYLKKFGGRVEERFEENTRILQQIGREKYQQELDNLENPEYKKLILLIFRDISPLDAYYETKDKQISGFCKVVFFPFPMMLRLSFDNLDQIIELTGFEDLYDFYEQNMKPEIFEVKQKRLKLRALNGQIVYYTYIINSQNSKSQELNRISKNIDSEITYTYGKFVIKSDIPTKFKVPNGSKIDVGKGMKCYLVFKVGVVRNLDGKIYRAPSCTLTLEDLKIQEMNDYESIIDRIIQLNEGIWQKNIRKVQENIEKFKMNMIGDFLQKQKVLSYGFNLNIFSAPYENLIDSQKMFQELKKEMNFDLEIISEKEKYKFMELYEIIDLCDQSEFFSYLYLLFKDIWKNNKDISIIKKNEDILDPDKVTCLIYLNNKNLNDWKDILLSRGLRKQNGKGYFNDLIFDNIHIMVKNIKDAPLQFLLMNERFENEMEHNNFQQNQIFNKCSDIENNIPTQQLQLKQKNKQNNSNSSRFQQNNIEMSIQTRNISQKSMSGEYSQIQNHFASKSDRVQNNQRCFSSESNQNKEQFSKSSQKIQDSSLNKFHLKDQSNKKNNQYQANNINCANEINQVIQQNQGNLSRDNSTNFDTNPTNEVNKMEDENQKRDINQIKNSYKREKNDLKSKSKRTKNNTENQNHNDKENILQNNQIPTEEKNNKYPNTSRSSTSTKSFLKDQTSNEQQENRKAINSTTKKQKIKSKQTKIQSTTEQRNIKKISLPPIHPNKQLQKMIQQQNEQKDYNQNNNYHNQFKFNQDNESQNNIERNNTSTNINNQSNELSFNYDPERSVSQFVDHSLIKTLPNIEDNDISQNQDIDNSQY